MLVFETLKKNSDFLNSNTCFYSQLYEMYFRNFLHFTHVLIDSTVFNTVYNYIMAALIELKELSLTRIEIHMMFLVFWFVKNINAQEKN